MPEGSSWNIRIWCRNIWLLRVTSIWGYYVWEEIQSSLSIYLIHMFHVLIIVLCMSWVAEDWEIKNFCDKGILPRRLVIQQGHFKNWKSQTIFLQYFQRRLAPPIELLLEKHFSFSVSKNISYPFVQVYRIWVKKWDKQVWNIPRDICKRQYFSDSAGVWHS